MRTKEKVSSDEIGSLEDVLPDIRKEKEEELTDAQELFIALLKGNDKKIKEKLYHYIYGKEYHWAHDGGEPDLGELLAIKLLEKLRGQKSYMSIIYQEAYLEHVGILSSSKQKGGKT